MAPVLGLHTRVVHLVLTERNPFSMALQISSRLPSSDENAMTDGPAPLMVNPFAPAAMTAFFIRSKPGIENFLAGSTITSLTASPITCESFTAKAAAILADEAFLRTT